MPGTVWVLALFDDRVAFRAEAGTHEDVLNVAKAGLATVDQVLAFAGAEKAAGDGYFAGFICMGNFVDFWRLTFHRFGSGSVVVVWVDQDHGDSGHSHGFAAFGAREDDIFHAGTAEAFCGLFAEHPADGVAEVRLSATVGADNGGNATAVEPQFGSVAERLKTLNFNFLQLKHEEPPLKQSPGESESHLSGHFGGSKVAWVHHAGLSSGYPQDIGVVSPDECGLTSRSKHGNNA